MNELILINSSTYLLEQLDSDILEIISLIVNQFECILQLKYWVLHIMDAEILEQILKATNPEFVKIFKTNSDLILKLIFKYVEYKSDPEYDNTIYKMSNQDFYNNKYLFDMAGEIMNTEREWLNGYVIDSILGYNQYLLQKNPDDFHIIHTTNDIEIHDNYKTKFNPDRFLNKKILFVVTNSDKNEGIHWRVIIIDRIRHHLYFFDPLGNFFNKNSLSLCIHFGVLDDCDYKIIDLRAKMQSDSYNCGIWSIYCIIQYMKYFYHDHFIYTFKQYLLENPIDIKIARTYYLAQFKLLKQLKSKDKVTTTFKKKVSQNATLKKKVSQNNNDNIIIIEEDDNDDVKETEWTTYCLKIKQYYDNKTESNIDNLQDYLIVHFIIDEVLLYMDCSVCALNFKEIWYYIIIYSSYLITHNKIDIKLTEKEQKCIQLYKVPAIKPIVDNFHFRIERRKEFYSNNHSLLSSDNIMKELKYIHYELYQLVYMNNNNKKCQYIKDFIDQNKKRILSSTTEQLKQLFSF